mgnify:CR=1 FL=1
MTQTTKRRIPELLFPGILRFLLGMRTFYSPAVFSAASFWFSGSIGSGTLLWLLSRSILFGILLLLLFLVLFESIFNRFLFFSLISFLSCLPYLLFLVFVYFLYIIPATWYFSSNQRKTIIKSVVKKSSEKSQDHISWYPCDFLKDSFTHNLHINKTIYRNSDCSASYPVSPVRIRTALRIS